MKDSLQRTQVFSEPFPKDPKHPHWACREGSSLMESLRSSRLAAGGQVGYRKASQVALDADA